MRHQHTTPSGLSFVRRRVEPPSTFLCCALFNPSIKPFLKNWGGFLDGIIQRWKIGQGRNLRQLSYLLFLQGGARAPQYLSHIHVLRFLLYVQISELHKRSSQHWSTSALLRPRLSRTDPRLSRQEKQFTIFTDTWWKPGLKYRDLQHFRPSIGVRGSTTDHTVSQSEYFSSQLQQEHEIPPQSVEAHTPSWWDRAVPILSVLQGQQSALSMAIREWLLRSGSPRAEQQDAGVTGLVKRSFNSRFPDVFNVQTSMTDHSLSRDIQQRSSKIIQGNHHLVLPLVDLKKYQWRKPQFSKSIRESGRSGHQPDDWSSMTPLVGTQSSLQKPTVSHVTTLHTSQPSRHDNVDATSENYQKVSTQLFPTIHRKPTYSITEHRPRLDATSHHQTAEDIKEPTSPLFAHRFFVRQDMIHKRSGDRQPMMNFVNKHFGMADKIIRRQQAIPVDVGQDSSFTQHDKLIIHPRMNQPQTADSPGSRIGSTLIPPKASGYLQPQKYFQPPRFPRNLHVVHSGERPQAFADTLPHINRQTHTVPTPRSSLGMKSFVQYRLDVSQMGPGKTSHNRMGALDVRHPSEGPYPQLAYVPGQANRESAEPQNGSAIQNSMGQWCFDSSPQKTVGSPNMHGTDISTSQPLQAQLVSRHTVGIVANKVYDLLVERVKRECSIFRR